MNAPLCCALFLLSFCAVLQAQPQSAGPRLPESTTDFNAPSAPPASSAATPAEQLAALAQQASQRFQAGDGDGAVKAEQAALEIAQRSFGPTSDEASQVCLKLAEIYRAAFHQQEAIEWMRRAIANHEKNGDTKSAAYGMAQQILGETYLDISSERLALEAFKVANKVLVAALPEKDLAVVTSWHDLGVGYLTTGYLEEAQTVFEKALALRRELTGNDSVPVAFTEHSLGRLYEQRRHFDKAEPLLLDSVRIMAMHEKDQPDKAGSFTLGLVALYVDMHCFDKAEQQVQEAQHIFERHFPPDHPIFARLYAARSLLRKQQGRLPEAEADLLKSLEINEKINKTGSSVAGACFGLGEFYRSAGFSAKAEEYLQRALEVVKESMGENSLYYAKNCKALADFYADDRDDAQRALPYAQTTFLIYQKLHSPVNLNIELFYGEIAMNAGRPDIAKPLLEDVSARYEREHLTDSSRYLRLQSELTLVGGGQKMKWDGFMHVTIQSELARLKEAQNLPLTDKWREMTIASAHASAALFYLRNGQAREALPHMESALPVILKKNLPGSVQCRDAVESMAYARFDLNEKEDPAVTEEFLTGEMASVENMLSMDLDYDREHWVTTEWPFDMLCSIGSARQAALLALRTKNLILDLNEENRRLARATTTPEGHNLWDLLVQQKAQCREAVSSGDLLADVRNLMHAKQETERALAAAAHVQQRVRPALAHTLDELQAALPEDAALLDYVTYSHRANGGDTEMRYAIIVHRKGREPTMHDAGSSHRQVDSMVQLFRHAMALPGKNPKEKSAALGELLQQAAADILGPVLPELDGVKTLIISPDAELQTLPFSVLLDKDGHFYGERFRIQYVNSARDLLRPVSAASAQANHGIALFGGATYRLGTPLGVAQRFNSLEKARSLDLLHDRSGVVFAPLPGTARELALISDLAAKKNWTFKAYSEQDASEANLRRLSPAPQVLHIATHGYYFPRPPFEATGRRATKWPDHGLKLTLIMDPQRCGLLFAGAQDSLDFWRQGLHLPQENDGFLNLEEVQELNLTGTQLVVLSACDSGLGDAVPNGGIGSLRSAFLSAGAQHVISTLWPILDADTADFMAQFYQRYMTTGRVGNSLQETQREWLVKARQEKGLWMAIKQAGGFILGSSGWEN